MDRAPEWRQLRPNKVRFPSPVPVGKRIRGSTQLPSVEEVASSVQITIEVKDNPKPVAVIDLVGRTVLLTVVRRSAHPARARTPEA